MSQRKNNIRSKVNTCFLCGSRFENISQKKLHRINKKKNSSINNVVVLCDECKKYIQKYCGDNIYLAYTPKHNRKIYFRDLGKDYRAIIMSKIRYFRNKDKDNEIKKEG